MNKTFNIALATFAALAIISVMFKWGTIIKFLPLLGCIILLLSLVHIYMGFRRMKCQDKEEVVREKITRPITISKKRKK
jgi:hypothetical protein